MADPKDPKIPKVADRPLARKGPLDELFKDSEGEELAPLGTPAIADIVDDPFQDDTAAGLEDVLGLQVGIGLSVSPETMAAWAAVKKREGEDARYVADQKKAGIDRECVTREAEAVSMEKRATIEKEKEVDVAKATHTIPSKHRLIQQGMTLAVAVVFMVMAIVATKLGLLPNDKLGGVLIAIAVVFGANEIAKTITGKKKKDE